MKPLAMRVGESLESQDRGRDPKLMITLTVPGKLTHRALVLRVIESSCKLVRGNAPGRDWFDNQVVSAFSEAFNNVAIHGYRDRPGEVRIEIETAPDGITIRMLDAGRSLDPARLSNPSLHDLPESGMGLYIIHSFVDSVTYEPRSPPDGLNVLCLKKRLRRAGVPVSAPKEDPQ